MNVEVAGLATRLILRRNGKIERQVDSGHLAVQGASAGVYRLEVYLLNDPLLPIDVRWIVSTPIFVGGLATFAPSRIVFRTHRCPRTQNEIGSIESSSAVRAAR